jgi:hypothetical protein
MMIFLVIVFFVLAMIGAVSYIDHSNVKKIEGFLQDKGCTEVNYSRGVYQGLCKDKVIIMANGFKIDLNEAQIIYYDQIRRVTAKQEKKLLLHTQENNTELKFLSNEERDAFYGKLKEEQHQ